VLKCDGEGGIKSVVDDADKPVDGNACTDDVCTNGAPSNPPVAADTSCGGNNQICDGAGHCVGCLVAADCPGEDTPCQTRTCDTNFVCGVDNAADGTMLVSQAAGDCKVAQCDGHGNVKQVTDTTDVHVDGNACTQDVCTASTPSNPPLPGGSPCGGSNVCDGQGACVACLVPAHCGADSECRTQVCNADHTCGHTDAPLGTPLVGQIAGDCKVNACDGNGNAVVANDDTDFADDGNVCTSDVCMAGTLLHPNKDLRAACGGSNFCDGNGRCVGCLIAGDCGTDTACQLNVCKADNTCGISNVDAGTVIAAQTPGDCQVVQCNGAGATISVNDDNDITDDGNACTNDVCAAGTPTHPPKDARTSCLVNQLCDGAGSCVQCLANADCGASTDCTLHVCKADHTCDVTLVAAGTPVATQTAGDCKVVVCDDAGATTVANDDNDTASDGNACTDDVCNAGVPAHNPTAAGTACGTGLVCDGRSICISNRCSGPPCVWFDDFEDGDAVGWTTVEQQQAQAGIWGVASEVGHTGAATLDYQQTALTTQNHYQYASGMTPVADQTVTAWIKFTTDINDTNHKVGVCARYTFNGSHADSTAYCFFLRQDAGATRGHIQVQKKTSGGLASIVDTTNGIPLFVLGTWYKVSLQVSGSAPAMLVASVNDAVLSSSTDATAPLTGGVGALFARQTVVSFDDVLVTSP
jgi:hypothetical protein